MGDNKSIAGKHFVISCRSIMFFNEVVNSLEKTPYPATIVSVRVILIENSLKKILRDCFDQGKKKEIGPVVLPANLATEFFFTKIFTPKQMEKAEEDENSITVKNVELALDPKKSWKARKFNFVIISNDDFKKRYSDNFCLVVTGRNRQVFGAVERYLPFEVAELI